MGILLGIMLTIAAVCLIASYLCYRIGFYVPPRKQRDPDFIDLPEGEIYEPFHESMTRWVLEARALPQERFSITSFDKLQLWGTYYEYAPGAPMELMFHGYRGNAERDLSGGVQRCFSMGRSAFIVDQRCAGRSEGNTITFGIHERRDCLAWVDFLVKHFGSDVKIILTGISMGGATVLMAAGEELPENVIGILSDCAYSTPRDIIIKTIRQMGLPPVLSYPFVKLGARLFGHFDLEETSPVDAMKNCRLPVIFFHGETDDYVPCYMSREVFDACPTRKMLVTIPGAGHGLSYAVARDRYLRELGEFFGPEASCR